MTSLNISGTLHLRTYVRLYASTGKYEQLQNEGQIGEFILDLVYAILGIYYKVRKIYYGTAGEGWAKWRAK